MEKIVDGRDKPGHDEKEKAKGETKCLKLP